MYTSAVSASFASLASTSFQRPSFGCTLLTFGKTCSAVLEGVRPLGLWLWKLLGMQCKD